MKYILLLLLFTLPAFALPAFAQQPVLPPAPQPQQSTHDKAQAELQQEENQRMLGIVPAFHVVMNGSAAPLNAKQKFQLFAKDAFDPFEFVAAGIDAGWEQYRNDYPEWGTDPPAYGKRFGASFGDALDSDLWARAILPSALHQDPRYFRLGHGGFGKRLGYSLISAVRSKGDNGKWQPNYSNVGGNFISGAIANVYYPAKERGVSLTLQRSGTTLGERAFVNLVYEFYPDVIAPFKKTVHHDKTQ
jgi:hypothetical protein